MTAVNQIFEVQGNPNGSPYRDRCHVEHVFGRNRADTWTNSTPSFRHDRGVRSQREGAPRSPGSVRTERSGPRVSRSARTADLVASWPVLACLVAGGDQGLGPLEIASIPDSYLKVAGAEVTDLGHVAGEA